MHSTRCLRVLFAVFVVLATLAAPALAHAQVADAPTPVTFPRDDGPHNAPVEWWYVTGHLFTETGDRYGFEFVVFKAQLNGATGYAAHFAVTDNARGEFSYDQRLGFAPDGANDPTDDGFDLQAVDWRMSGVNGHVHISAAMADYAIELDLASAKPAVLHDGDGYIDYGDRGGSYYYSRTRIDVAGTMTVDGDPLAITGIAWFDHQWGAFTTYIDGGWDWFAVQLDDDTELMLYVIGSEDGELPIVDGSYVDAAGSLTVLGRGAFTITSGGEWTSDATGVEYPSGWEIAIPALSLTLVLDPSLPDQELDTRQSTGVIYWEGEVTVTGDRDGQPVTGLGYVELTGRAPVEAVATPAA